MIDRGRRSIGIDLKHPSAAPRWCCASASAPTCCSKASGPASPSGSASGPDACRARNPRLVYARMTGWGQDGPLAGDVGHDVNYLSIAGVLWHIGPEGGAPVPPINLLADFGGGGSLVVMGILAALVERGDVRRGPGRRRGDGRRQRAADEHLLRARRDGRLGSTRGTNLLDGGAHFYNVYETADGEYVSIAAYEPKFYANLLALLGPLGFDDLDPAAQMDRRSGPALKARLGGAVPHPHASRVGRVLRRPRGVLRAGAVDVARRAPIRTTSRATRSSTSTARPSPRPRPASAARRAVQGAPVSRGPTPTPRSPNGASARAEIAQLKADGAIA